jgi:hypothetical protein
MATSLQTTLVRNDADVVVDLDDFSGNYILLSQTEIRCNPDVIMIDKNEIKSLIRTLEKFERKLNTSERAHKNKSLTVNQSFEDKMTLDN